MSIEEDRIEKADCVQYLETLPDHCIDACITDPPYNISGYDHKKEIGWYKSNALWKQEKGFNKITENWDKFTNSSYIDFTANWIGQIKRVTKPNGNIFIFGSYHNIFKIGFILEMLDLRIINSIVWYKRNAFPNITNRMFCESTECIIWAANNSQKKAKNWTFNYAVAKELNGGKQMRNMWDIPMTPKSEKNHGKHPSQKPIEVVSRLVMCCTNENNLIVDPFCGSGTVPVVCKMLNRRFLGIDNNADYVDLTNKRLRVAELIKEKNVSSIKKSSLKDNKRVVKQLQKQESLLF